jgi:hypothetical protein
LQVGQILGNPRKSKVFKKCPIGKALKNKAFLKKIALSKKNFVPSKKNLPQTLF